MIKKFCKKIKHEEIFIKFSQIYNNVDANEIGREQFFKHQSYGSIPDSPDFYFLRLCDGKKWFDYQIQAYIELYLSNEWWGWHQILKDFKEDKWLIPFLFPWKKDNQGNIDDKEIFNDK